VTEPYLGYQQAVISPVAITGRTSLRANGIVGMKAVGSLINTTASRTAQPFTQPFSGLRQIGHAYFGGNADALGLDVSEGQIGRLRFARGLGGPGGAIDALPYSGTPIGKRGYPAFGLQGGVIAARRLGDLTAAPSTLVLQTSQDPSNVQRLTTNATEYFARPGDALIGAAVTTDGQIRRAHLVGNLRESRISSGFNYRSYVQGLDPTRQPSAIEHYDQRGDLVDSVVTASYRSSNGVFGGESDQAGRGLIRGNLRGNLYNTRKTPGGIQDIAGAGFFARRKIGYLPPVESSPRVQSVLRRV
jgi:hypothetical protein